MRLILLVAVLAVAAVLVMFLLGEDTDPLSPRPERRDASGTAARPPDGHDGRAARHPDLEADLPDLRGPLEGGLPRPQTRAEIERFLAAVRRLGPAAVPELRRRLRDGADLELEPRWVIREGRVQGWPTLRSVYLAALASIEGERATRALREVFSAEPSAHESLQIAAELAARGESGFEGQLLRRADQAAGIDELPAQRAMVELAARRAPAVTAEHIQRATPRGEEPGDPRALAYALSVLPVDTAIDTARGLLAERAVTRVSKSRYVRALAERRELAPLRVLRDAVTIDNWSEPIRIDAAHALVGSTAFLQDEQEMQVARAGRDPRRVEELRARMEERLRLTKEWIEAALGFDLETSDDPRAVTMRHRLARVEQLLQRTR